MGEIPSFRPEVGDKEDEKGLQDEGYGNEEYMYRIFNNGLALEGEDDDEGKKQAGDGHVAEFGDEGLLKIRKSTVFGDEDPGEPSGTKRYYHKQYD